MAAIVWDNDLIKAKGLTLLSTTLRLVLCNTTPASKALATSTANCCGISLPATSTDVVTVNAIEDFGGTPAGRMRFIQKTTDISARKASTRVIKAVALINASTLLFVTKCSTRAYSTAGPDKINASSWAIIFYDASTAS